IGAKTGWNSLSKWLGVIFKGFKVFLLDMDYPEYLILEMGVDMPCDMERMMAWIKPDIGVITAFGSVPVHVEQFEEPEDLMKEKWKLIENLKDDDIAVLNNDDKTIVSYGKKLKIKTATFGFFESADICASNYKINSDGIVFKISYGGSIAPVKLNMVFGRQNVYTAMSAISVGLYCGINLIKCITAVSKMKPVSGRFNLLEGVNNSLIFDDTYNSSPVAVEMAVETLSEYPAKRRIAVLGDMKELGEFSQGEHKRIGEILRAKDVWFLFTVGKEAKYFAEGARKSGFDTAKIFEFDNTTEAGEAVKQIIQEGDLILVKGSQSARMEKAVEKIMAHPENKETFLVRQEEEWKNK
ncbi:MAG: UDP-N-acetylmuramoyl-tripeptide--D-alanyl-D-alanine ligase, partial [Patescibacteria group bacterium]